MKHIRIIGGPLAKDIRFIDCETGQLIKGITGFSVHGTPQGILCQITQLFQVVDFDLRTPAEDVDVIALPDAFKP